MLAAADIGGLEVAVSENGGVTTGVFTISDADGPQEEAFVASSTSRFGLDFDVQANGQWTLTVSDRSFQRLDAGDVDSGRFGVETVDGTRGTFQYEIIGENDIPFDIDGDFTAQINNDFEGDFRGILNVRDVDQDDGQFFQEQLAPELGDYGTFTRSGRDNGLWAYTPDADAVADLSGIDTVSDTFLVTSRDGTATTSVTIRIRGTNQHVDDVVTTEGDAPVTFNLFDNDPLVEGDVRLLRRGSSTNGGSVSFGGDGNVTYTPSEQAILAGTDSFDLILTAENRTGFVSTVTVIINPAVDSGDSAGFTLVNTNDWFNSDSNRGGFIATYEYTVSEDSIIGDDLFAWGIQSGYSGGGEITNVWLEGFNGSTSKQTDSFDITNIDESFRPELKVGDSFKVSFQVNGAGFDEADFSPTFLDSDPEPVEADDSDVEITAAQTNDWGSGFVQKVKLDNVSQDTIRGWSLILDVPEGETFDLTNVWGATAETLENGDILFTGLSWNEDISAGGAIDFGFQGDNATMDAVMIEALDFTWV